LILWFFLIKEKEQKNYRFSQTAKVFSFGVQASKEMKRNSFVKMSLI